MSLCVCAVRGNLLICIAIIIILQFDNVRSQSAIFTGQVFIFEGSAFSNNFHMNFWVGMEINL